VLFDVVGETSDLLGAVGFRNRNQNGLVETPAEKLDLTRSHEFLEPLKIVEMMFLYPEEQRAGVVKGQLNPWMLLDQRKKGFVGILITLFKDMLEIASRLMGVNDEHEVKWRAGRRHGTHTP